MLILKANQYNMKNLYFSVRITKTLDEIFYHTITIGEASMDYRKTIVAFGD